MGRGLVSTGEEAGGLSGRRWGTGPRGGGSGTGRGTGPSTPGFRGKAWKAEGEGAGASKGRFRIEWHWRRRGRRPPGRGHTYREVLQSGQWKCMDTRSCSSLSGSKFGTAPPLGVLEVTRKVLLVFLLCFCRLNVPMGACSPAGASQVKRGQASSHWDLRTCRPPGEPPSSSGHSSGAAGNDRSLLGDALGSEFTCSLPLSGFVRGLDPAGSRPRDPA